MALSTSRTVVTETGLSTNSTYNVGGVLAGVSNLHTIGYDVVDSNTGTGVTVRSTGNASFTGVITAASFSGSFTGDGQNLTGLPAGLGTALSNTQTDALNKIYFTNRVLSISTTTTVDPPATASAAYTQYTDIAISNGSDLIIKDGDELVPDVLGLSTSALPVTNLEPNIGGRLRVSQITNTNANGAPNFPNGLTVTGIVTASTLNTSTNQITVSNSAVVGSAVTANITGIDVTGVVTATTFSGALAASNLTGALPALDGSNLTGIDSSSLSFGGATKIQANNSGVIVTGILTTTQYRPGEIIETIAAICDGRTVSVQSGNYTIANVTGAQAATDSYATATGSEINYTPPTGTKQLVYNYEFQWDANANSGISHVITQVDGTTIVPAQRGFSSNYASTNWNHAQFRFSAGYTFDLNAGSTDATQGQYAAGDWTSAKTIRVQFRRYNSSYSYSLHRNTHWNGTNASGTDQAPIKPTLYIQAIA